MAKARMAMVRVRRNRVRYVVISPCCALLVAEMRGVLREVLALGPNFSSQVWSIIWLAIFCPSSKPSLGGSRWITVGKNANIFEKWCGSSFGVGWYCLLVKEASSRAMRSPKSVTARAASLRRGGIVRMGVLIGRRFEVINNPVKILPQASRLMGLIRAESFSLIGARGRHRGCPKETK